MTTLSKGKQRAFRKVFGLTHFEKRVEEFFEATLKTNKITFLLWSMEVKLTHVF